MRPLKRILLALMCEMQLNLCFAKVTPDVICEPQGYVIIYGNGILNTDADMEMSTQRLSELMGNSYKGEEIIYDNAVNPSGWMIEDLIEVIEQKVAENPDFSWELVAKAAFSIGSGTTGVVLSLYNTIGQILLDNEFRFFPQSLAALKQQFIQDADFEESLTNEHAALFKDYIINKKRKVLLAAHSQGNLYANISIKALYEDVDITTKSLAMVGVASPANYVVNNDPYITSSSDMVINGLRYLTSGRVLPNNVDLPFNSSDVAGHSFLNTYTNPNMGARSRLKTLITKQLTALQNPPTGKWTIRQYYQYMEKIEPMGNLTVISQVAGTKNMAGFVLYKRPGSEPNPLESQEYFNAKGQPANSKDITELANAVKNEYLVAIEKLCHGDFYSYMKFTNSVNFVESHIPRLSNEEASKPHSVKDRFDNNVISPVLKTLSLAPNIAVSTVSNWPNKTLEITICPTE